MIHIPATLTVVCSPNGRYYASHAFHARPMENWRRTGMGRGWAPIGTDGSELAMYCSAELPDWRTLGPGEWMSTQLAQQVARRAKPCMTYHSHGTWTAYRVELSYRGRTSAAVASSCEEARRVAQARLVARLATERALEGMAPSVTVLHVGGWYAGQICHRWAAWYGEHAEYVYLCESECEAREYVLDRDRD